MLRLSRRQMASLEDDLGGLPSRVRTALRNLTAANPIDGDEGRHGRQRVTRIWMPGLDARPWWDPVRVGLGGWQGGLCLRLMKEAMLLVRAGVATRPYERSTSPPPSDYPTPLAQGWRVLALIEDGVWSYAMARRAAQGLALLDRLPWYPGDAMYSVLRASTAIPPHHGLDNLCLTIHLPLVAPRGAALTVAGSSREWRLGQPLVFDDSFEHSAVNPAAHDRIVFLVDVWHPGLSEVERRAWRCIVQRCKALYRGRS
ncbi:aspartyl/asparaginyl beta-hydroxylase domain-containing protein [Halomonas sp. V046]|uniref:aspartyl/asparaginyl beta-hydroxylase domain-containing protein n=1 Tax=Halomonas sp. V046 TaxID=3459611 RepID=UPI0040446E58